LTLGLNVAAQGATVEQLNVFETSFESAKILLLALGMTLAMMHAESPVPLKLTRAFGLNRVIPLYCLI